MIQRSFISELLAIGERSLRLLCNLVNKAVR